MEDKKRKKDEKRKREASQKVSVFVLPDSMSSRTDILKFKWTFVSWHSMQAVKYVHIHPYHLKWQFCMDICMVLLKWLQCALRLTHLNCHIMSVGSTTAFSLDFEFLILHYAISDFWYTRIYNLTMFDKIPDSWSWLIWASWSYGVAVNTAAVELVAMKSLVLKCP